MGKVLLIEDDARMRLLLSRILAGAGHAVTEAADGRDGMVLFHQIHPDLVVTDILMPTKEGIQVINEIRAEDSRTRIIAVSGGGQTRNMHFLDIAKHFGADAVIAKPFRAAEFRALVDRVLAPLPSRVGSPP